MYYIPLRHSYLWSSVVMKWVAKQSAGDLWVDSILSNEEELQPYRGCVRKDQASSQ